MVRNWVSHRIRQKDDLSPITKGFHAFAKARTVGPAGRLFRPFSSRWKGMEWNSQHGKKTNRTRHYLRWHPPVADWSRTSPEGIAWLDGGSWHLGTGEPATPGKTIKALQQIYVQSPSIPFLLLKRDREAADFYLIRTSHSRRHRPVVRKQDTNRTSQPTDGKIRITDKKRNQWWGFLSDKQSSDWTSQQADRVAQPFPPKRNPPMGSGGLYQQPRQNFRAKRIIYYFPPTYWSILSMKGSDYDNCVI